MKSILFRKTNSKMDDVEFLDSGNVVKKLQNPKQRILPHDLLHALVERELRVRGFISQIFDGVEADPEAWFVEAMVESLQGMLWSGVLEYDQFDEWVKSICDMRKVPSVEIDKVRFSQLSSSIEKYSKAWRDIQAGDFLEFVWQITEPQNQ